MGSEMPVKILLLQARRPADPMREHERECFVNRTGVPEDNVVAYNLMERPPSLSQARRYDAVMIGGSGEFYVSKGNLPFFEQFSELLQELAETGHPTFGSCFGYQSLVHALGGEVTHDPGNTEVGTFALELESEARADPLFADFPGQFNAQMGHKDRALRHPEGIPNLARSPRSPLQALRIPGKPIWATQFHPELCHITNKARFAHYLDGYAPYMSEQERREALDAFVQSPETTELLRRFLDLVFA